MATKTCFKCGELKPLESYYRHSCMADGHLNKCISCTRKDVMDHRLKNLDRIRQYDRDRYQTNDKRKEQYNSLRFRRPPEHIRANYALGNAIRDGRVIRAEACWHCGSTERIEGHHVDYSRPLDVVWLCRSCHCKAHRQTTLSEQQAA